jgi:hypothetical protein
MVACVGQQQAAPMLSQQYAAHEACAKDDEGGSTEHQAPKQLTDDEHAEK